MNYNISASKPTQDQLIIISCIEDVLRIKFLGETEEDAKKFIASNICEYIDICMQ